MKTEVVLKYAGVTVCPHQSFKFNENRSCIEMGENEDQFLWRIGFNENRSCIEIRSLGNP